LKLYKFYFCFLICAFLFLQSCTNLNLTSWLGANDSSSSGFATGQALVGVYYDDQQGGTMTDFQDLVGHRVTIDFHYHHFIWGGSAAQYDIDDVKNGFVPLIAWEPSTDPGQCVTAKDVAAGVYDADLEVQAQQIKALGVPVMLDFIPEMTNFERDSGSLDCFYGGPGWQDSDAGIMAVAISYVEAQHHVVDLFRKNDVTNAVWIFAPGGLAYGSQLVAGKPSWTYFYPGNDYVDWLGMDYYTGNMKALRFEDDPAVHAFYDAASATGKPLLLAQTCAHAVEGMNPDPQTAWIASAQASIPTQFPAIHAFVYNDQYSRNGDSTLYLQGTGLTAFIQMLNDPAFNATDPTIFMKK
jgi:hypothetical protein